MPPSESRRMVLQKMVLGRAAVPASELACFCKQLQLPLGHHQARSLLPPALAAWPQNKEVDVWSIFSRLPAAIVHALRKRDGGYRHVTFTWAKAAGRIVSNMFRQLRVQFRRSIVKKTWQTRKSPDPLRFRQFHLRSHGSKVDQIWTWPPASSLQRLPHTAAQ